MAALGQGAHFLLAQKTVNVGWEMKLPIRNVLQQRRLAVAKNIKRRRVRRAYLKALEEKGLHVRHCEKRGLSSLSADAPVGTNETVAAPVCDFELGVDKEVFALGRNAKGVNDNVLAAFLDALCSTGTLRQGEVALCFLRCNLGLKLGLPVRRGARLFGGLEVA
jgi:hypothetical protein